MQVCNAIIIRQSASSRTVFGMLCGPSLRVTVGHSESRAGVISERGVPRGRSRAMDPAMATMRVLARRHCTPSAVSRLRQLAAAAGTSSQRGARPTFVDIVWMHNGWDFLVPMMQQRLDTISSHRCVIRQATYDAHGRLELSSLAGARVLVPAMAPISSDTLDAAGPGVELVYPSESSGQI